MQYQFAHSMPASETQKLAQLGQKLSYSQGGLWLYRFVVFSVSICLAAMLFIFLPFWAAIAIIFLFAPRLDGVFGRFLAPHFDKYFSKVRLPAPESDHWSLHFDAQGLVYRCGYNTTHLQWSGVAKIVEHKEAIIFYSVHGTRFVPASCFTTEAERAAFLSDVRTLVPEGAAIPAVFN